MFAALFLAVLLALDVGSAWAIDPSEMLADPKQEARADRIGKELRCVVCQSESIEESNADLAHDMRTIVRERIKAGDTDKQVVDFMVSRYGDYVLMDPPFKATTIVLWVGPFALLVFGLGIAATVFHRRKAKTAGETAPVAEQALSAEEQRRLDRLLGGDRS
jgi:cytochrome c-type biogenesis protein CcmH